MIHQLNTRFTQGIIRGEAREKIIKDMKKALNSSAKATKRLVLTESAFVASASRKDCFEELGVEKYQFLATLDLKTSVICQDMDGKVFERKDYQIGVTAPPMHPHCRSTTVPYFDDTLTQTEQRAARGEDGKTYTVPADMTYQQWYEKYVKSSKTLTLEEERAIMNYISSDSYKINDKLRHGMALTQREQGIVKNLDKALNKIPKYKGIISRSVDLDGEQLKEFLKEYTLESTVKLKAYTSFTKGETYNPMAKVQLYTYSRNGRNITDFNEGEAEILYPRNSKFVVRKVTQTDDIYHIVLDEVN